MFPPTKHTKSLTGMVKTSSRLYAMANSLCGVEPGVLAGKINSLLESVCRHQEPLDVRIVLLYSPVPVNYIIDTDTILQLMTKINVNKAVGPDDILGWILSTMLSFNHPVCTIFKACILGG